MVRQSPRMHNSCLFLSVLLLIGCGRAGELRETGRSAAKGIVTIDGRPLTGGSITLVSIDDPKYRVTAPIRSEGVFFVADAPLGRVHVAVETESIRNGDPSSFVPIPSKYAKAETSGLTATIADDGDKNLHFELTNK